MNTVDLRQGDCRQVMAEMEPESIDAIVTDPPYDLTSGSRNGSPSTFRDNPYGRSRIGNHGAGGGFMGKGWDASGVAFDPATWAEALRVLKPGGHLLSFGGTRTHHRMMVAIEDAGFEIRDCLMWLYGSGFPKSLNVSKAIDKRGPNPNAPLFPGFGRHYEERRKAAGLSHKEVCEIGGWYGAVNHGGSSSNWGLGLSLPTMAQWEILEPLLGLDEKWRVRVEREEYEREVIGTRKVNRGLAFTSDGPDELPVTVPASDLARQWDGWGTALKPSVEPIILARKPLIGTVAANVERHGTGALNIDACRIGTTKDVPASPNRTKGTSLSGSVDGSLRRETGNEDGHNPNVGRWPANLVLDEEAAAMLGTSSRFFYVAKASRRERNAGLDEMPDRGDRPLQLSNWSGQTNGSGDVMGPSSPQANSHPCVKPIALMRWLVRLITPPGGVVLDPFLGSGSTGCAAVLEGFDFIGIELDENEGYIEIARRRIAHWQSVGYVATS